MLHYHQEEQLGHLYSSGVQQVLVLKLTQVMPSCFLVCIYIYTEQGEDVFCFTTSYFNIQVLSVLILN